MSSGAQGYYGDLGQPLVALDLVGEDRSHTLTALVDTGFSRGAEQLVFYVKHI